MPHDKNGKPVQAGQEALVRVRVSQVFSDADTCNAQVVVADPPAKGDYQPTFTCDCKQLSLIEPTDTVPDMKLATPADVTAGSTPAEPSKDEPPAEPAASEPAAATPA